MKRASNAVDQSACVQQERRTCRRPDLAICVRTARRPDRRMTPWSASHHNQRGASTTRGSARNSARKRRIRPGSGRRAYRGSPAARPRRGAAVLVSRFAYIGGMRRRGSVKRFGSVAETKRELHLNRRIPQAVPECPKSNPAHKSSECRARAVRETARIYRLVIIGTACA